MILRKSLAGLAVALLATSAAGCSGKGGGSDAWEPPGKGQAAQLLDFSDGGRDAGTRDVAFYGFDGTPDGMATGADGSVYVAGQKVVRLKPDRTVSTALAAPAEKGAVSGVVPLPDGSLVFGADRQVKKADPAGHVTVLAGGRTFPVTPTPFGARSDGTVLFADQNVLWSLKDGAVEQLHAFPAKASDGLPLQVPPGGAVDASGTVYVAMREQGPSQTRGRLDDVLGIGADGHLSKPLLPKTLAGLPGSLAAYTVGWLTGDGADGVFAQIYDPSGDHGAVVHLHSGTVDLVARQNDDISYRKPCRIGKPVDALHVTCPLPAGMTYRSGSLVLGGTQDYVLQIRLT
ncbi:MAG TPA: hypothetical protein VGL02_17115 [Streptomyces sp.]